jgi:cephalosporin hydroxylase
MNLQEFFGLFLSNDNRPRAYQAKAAESAAEPASSEPAAPAPDNEFAQARRRRTIREFHRIFYNEKETTWLNTTWEGTPVAKCPLDLWVYQEIIFETKPDLIIETGTWNGGSALYMARLLDILGKKGSRLLSLDVESKDYPKHPRVTYLTGDSAAPEMVEKVKEAIGKKDRVMVILDSDHSAAHVRRELDAYAPLVSEGCYLIVEDTNLNGNPVLPDFGPGPKEALDAWLKTPAAKKFEMDASREKFLMTKNPGGYLRRRTEK